MPNRSKYKDIKVNQLFYGAGVPSSRTSAAVDTAGFDAVTLCVHTSGNDFTAANGCFIEIEHSDDNSTFVDCADSDVVGAIAGDTTGTVDVYNTTLAAGYKAYAYVGSKRYARLRLQVFGTFPQTDITVTSVLSLPAVAPVA